MTFSISVITVSHNSAKTIRDCLASISEQNFRAQHIIIDGGSTDGTIDIVKSFHHVSKFVSEPDRGIFDAMNKGIIMATGDVIGILNSDDLYANNNVLAKVANLFENELVDSCYGDLVYVDAANTNKIIRKWRSGSYNLQSFYWGWMPPHPTFFVRRKVYQEYGLFNLFFGTAADYELVLRFLLKNKTTTEYIPEVLVKMRSGGISNSSIRQRIRANRMDRKAWAINGLKPYPWTICLKPLRKVGQYITPWFKEYR